MINLLDFVVNGTLFKKLQVDDLLFVEVKCPVEDEYLAGKLWWHDHFISYALAGEMVLKTLQNEYLFKAGDCIFAKKGSILSAHHYIHEDFCELRVFIPDNFIKTVYRKYRLEVRPPLPENKSDTIIPLVSDNVLHAYFQSLLSYFGSSNPPTPDLLKLKFEELVVNLLSTGKNPCLKLYFNSLCLRNGSSTREIMENSFMKNLSLPEFARLCGKSLSAFKLEFKTIFHTTPGKWLREKRLDYARFLLDSTDDQLADICLQSGFENVSHFSHVFKQKFGLPPATFRNRYSAGGTRKI